MNDETYEGKERRVYYRLGHPYADIPKLMVWGDEYQAIDVSEEGVKFRCDEYSGVKMGQTISATITFQDGESFDLEGKIARIQDNEIAITLSKGIPYKKIVQEQRYLIRKYTRPRQA